MNDKTRRFCRTGRNENRRSSDRAPLSPQFRSLTEKQAEILRSFVTAGENKETGQSNYSEWKVSGRNRDYSVLYRRALLQLIEECRDPLGDYTGDVRYEITSTGRDIARQLIAGAESEVFHGAK